jgi:hypothetical protein
MTEKDIIDAYIKIRKIDNTIPDDVLDFMKDSAINKLNKSNSINCKSNYLFCEHWNTQLKGCLGCRLTYKNINE